MLRHRPALRVVILLIGGILLSGVLNAPGSILWILLSVFFFAVLGYSLLKPRALGTTLLIHFLVVLLSATWTTMRTSERDANRFSPEGLSAEIRMWSILEELPVKQGSSCKLVLFSDTVVFRERSIRGGRFLAFLPWSNSGSILSAQVGSWVFIRGRLEDFPRPRNPGEFDYGQYLSLNSIDGIVRVDSLGFLHGIGSGTLRSWFAEWRSELGRIFEKHHGTEQAAFLQGVVFGDRREISAELKRSFMTTGTIHILAVSGSNVALIAMMLYLLLGFFRLPKQWVVILTLLGLLMYMMLTGASSSIVRATLMGCVLVVGTAMERRTDIYNSISVAAAVVLLIDPLQLYDVGFQLSFAAVVSIVAIYPKLEDLIARIPEGWEELKILEPVWKLFAVSLAAQLGTLPFTALYFERISIVSLIANVVVVPLVGLNLILGCVTLAADFVSEWIAGFYAALNETLVNVLLGFVRVAADVPFAAVETYGFGLLQSVFFYALLIGVLNWSKARMVKYSLLSIVAIMTLVVYRDVTTRRPVLRMVALDVGQGDAILMEFSNGAHVLVDTGPRTPGFDSGERVVVPFLARQKIQILDAVVLSHPHSDHIGGMLALLKAVDVRSIVEGDTACQSRFHAAIRQEAETRGIPVRYAGVGMNLSPDPAARLYVLHPVTHVDRYANINNASLCLKLVAGSSTALLSGDAEEEAESAMTKRFGEFLRSDLLKSGHHGSATSSTGDFLHGITPKIALISVGAGNKFGHPSEEVLRSLESRGVTALRTDLDGALVFETDGTQWRRVQWRQQGSL